MIATFVGSFLLVFVGLRLIAPDPLSVGSTSGKPFATLGAPDAGRTEGAMPAMFDMRFRLPSTEVAVPAKLTLDAIERATRQRVEPAPEAAIAVPPVDVPADDGLAAPAAVQPAAAQPVEPPVSAPSAAAVEPPSTAAVERPASVPSADIVEPAAEALPVAKIEVAALPDPAVPADPPPRADRSAALEPDPEPVATAGTTELTGPTELVAVPALPRPRPKMKAVRQARPAAAPARAATPPARTTQAPAARRPAPKRTAAGTTAGEASSVTNPFSALFGNSQ
jgi:hypothetical protein